MDWKLIALLIFAVWVGWIIRGMWEHRDPPE